MDDINKLVVECVGTFFLILIILHSLNDNRIGAIGICVTLLILIYLGGNISGANYNPAVTIAMILNNKINYMLGMLYIVAQLLGALLAVLFNNTILKAKN